MAAMDRLRLLDAISRAFSREELRTLCFELNVEYDDLPADGRINKARELIQLCERLECLEALVRLCREKRPHVEWPALILAIDEDPAPFKGLAFYDRADAGLFFGREALTGELVEHLNRHRFLAVVGPSGSGKSSLVRAGLLPALQGNRPAGFDGRPPAGSASWPVFLLTPTAQPLKELAASLTYDAESVRATTVLMDDLAQDERSLDIAVRRLADRAQVPRVLIVVDQFEELFTLCRNEDERRAFIGNLATAAAPETTGPPVVVITLRADFYGHCLRYHAFHRLLEQQQKIAGPLTATEMRQAIEGPAAAQGLDYEPGLIDQVLYDLGVSGDRPPEPGTLPLLSHTLLETWRRRAGNELRLAGYYGAGGVRGAIAQTAETTYREFSTEQQAIARGVLLRLTEVNDSSHPTRRRAGLEELIPEGESPDATLDVLTSLVDARLVTTFNDRVEVIHEALVREWPTLRRWLDEYQTGLRLHRQLTEAAQAWEQSDHEESYLYRGARLEAAGAVTETSPIPLSDLERTFLSESRQSQIRQARNERVRQQRTRWSALGAAAGGAAGFGFSIWLIYSYLVASDQVLLFLTLVNALLGAITAVALVLLVDMAYQAAPEDGRSRIRYAWPISGLAGALCIGLLFAGHTLINVESGPSGIWRSSAEGALWGAGIGLGFAWLKQTGRPLWLTLPPLVVVWALLLLLANQFGHALSYLDQEPPAAVIALAGGIVPLAIYLAAKLAPNVLAGRVPVAQGEV
jgi:energy-coupling factor transporter ATP-binding protein EcfA2